MKNNRLVSLLDLFGGREEKDAVQFSVSKSPLYDRANGSSADTFLEYGEYGFSSMGI